MDGELVRSLGRPGEGPGEFEYLAGAWPRGDTIEAFDGDLMRITRFLPARGVPEPERIPAFWAFVVDSMGFIWVRPYDPFQHAVALGGLPGSSETPGRGGEWRVFTEAGVEVRSVTVPGELEPYEITEDVVVGVRRDELGVESVRVHALERR